MSLLYICLWAVNGVCIDTYNSIQFAHCYLFCSFYCSSHLLLMLNKVHKNGKQNNRQTKTVYKDVNARTHKDAHKHTHTRTHTHTHKVHKQMHIHTSHTSEERNGITWAQISFNLLAISIWIIYKKDIYRQYPLQAKRNHKYYITLFMQANTQAMTELFVPATCHHMKWKHLCNQLNT